MSYIQHENEVFGNQSERSDSARADGANALVLYPQAARSEGMADESRRRSRFRRGIPALALALCVVASSMFGFVGGWLSSQIQSEKNAASYSEAIQTLSAQLESALETAGNGTYEGPGLGSDQNDAISQSGAGSGEAAVGGATGLIDAVLAAVGDAAKPTNIAETAALAKNSVVEISTETATNYGRMGQYISEGAGSGVVITADGYIVTNNHVISGARTVSVRLADGKTYPATVKGADAKTDLAVLKINQTGLTPAVQGNSATLKVGEPAIAVGNPLGELGGSVTAGIISALDREIEIDGETFSLLQTDAAINPGNSGGGLFNMAGELVGVVNVKSTGLEIEGIGFAIPVNTAKPVISDLITYGYVRGRVDTGLSLVDVQDSRSAFVSRVNQLGLYVYSSTNKSLQNGDRITAANGVAVTDLASFNAVVNTCKVGDTMQITVVRGGQSITVALPLTELKS